MKFFEVTVEVVIATLKNGKDKKAKENVFKRRYTQESRISSLRLKSFVLVLVGMYTSLAVIVPFYVLISCFFF